MIFFPLELDGKIIRIAADRIGSVNRAGRIDEKSGPGKLAVLIDGVNFYDRLAATFEDGFDFAADLARGVVLRVGGCAASLG